jgi:hypothetical protein
LKSVEVDWGLWNLGALAYDRIIHIFGFQSPIGFVRRGRVPYGIVRLSNPSIGNQLLTNETTVRDLSAEPDPSG